MNDTSPPERESDVLARLALSSEAPAASTPCPTDVQFAAFIDGALDTASRRTLMTHMNQCPTCRQHWIEVSEILQEAADTASVTPQRPDDQAGPSRATPYWLDQLLTWLQPWRLALASVPLAAIGLAIWLSGATPVTDMIDQRFAVVATADGRLDEVAGVTPLPWENNALGFGPAIVTDAQRAFAAGLWQARARLVGQVEPLPGPLVPRDADAWADTPQAAYFEFGRWATLLQARLTGDTQLTDAAQHLAIAHRLQDLLAAVPDGTPAADAATRLGEGLARLVDGQQAESDRLSSQLTITLYALAPQQL